MSDPDDDPARTDSAGADDAGLARRVARNTAAPLAATVVERGLGLLLAMYAARVLGPVGIGAYTVAQNVWQFASIFAEFGLGILLTREVARDPPSAAQRTAATVGLRLVLATACAPAAALVTLLYSDRAILITVVLLAAGLFPAAIAGALSAVFAGHERMTTPAAVQLLSGVLTAALGFAVLAVGWGIIGLGGVSLAVSLLTAVVFIRLVRRRYFAPGIALVPRDLRAQLHEAWPLMLNNLLNSIFFRSDIQVLEAFRGRRAVGYYSPAFRIIDAIGLLPSRFVLALFPVLSRRAAPGDATFLGVYRLAVKLLLGIAVPIALGITVLAYDITRLFWGARFLPESAIALQILVWYVPGSFWNGLTQYVLIAVGQQRWITGGFFLATAFNVIANLLLVPQLWAGGRRLDHRSVRGRAVRAVCGDRASQPGYAPLLAGGARPTDRWVGQRCHRVRPQPARQSFPRRSRRGAIGLRRRVAGAATARPCGVAVGHKPLAACGAALRGHEPHPPGPLSIMVERGRLPPGSLLPPHGAAADLLGIPLFAVYRLLVSPAPRSGDHLQAAVFQRQVHRRMAAPV